MGQRSLSLSSLNERRYLPGFAAAIRALAFCAGLYVGDIALADSALNSAPRVHATYATPLDSTYEALREKMQRVSYLEEIAGRVNEVIALPRSVSLGFRECGEANAFYEPQLGSVVACYELASVLTERFDTRRLRDHLETHVAGTLTFVVLHEIAHALIDILNLAVTGREEDAADQLAVLLLLSYPDGQGKAAAASAALAFTRTKEKLNNSRFADDHSLSKQRSYNILCWVYGYDPKAQLPWIRSGTLPVEREAHCRDEFQQLSQAWNTLLGPYLKKPLP